MNADDPKPLVSVSDSKYPRDMTSLESATEDEIILELGRRNIGVLIVLSREVKGSARQEMCSFRHVGGFVQALGLAVAAHKHYMKQA